MVTITHPYHPLRGQQVEVIRVRRGTDPDLIVRLPDGFYTAIVMSGTDYITPPAPDPPTGPPHLLDLEGLRQMVQLIDEWRQKGHSRDGSADPETCSATQGGYDETR